MESEYPTSAEWRPKKRPNRVLKHVFNATNSPVDFEKNPHHQQHKNQDFTFRGKSQASYSSKPKLHAKLTSLEGNSATPSQEQSLRYSSDPQDLFKTSPSSHGLNSILHDSMETLDQSANRTLLSLWRSRVSTTFFFFFKSLLQFKSLLHFHGSSAWDFFNWLA